MTGFLVRVAAGTFAFLALLTATFAAEVVSEGSAPIRNGDIGQARELATRRALAQAVEMQSAKVSAQTLLREGVVLESAQVSSSACTENSQVIGETISADVLTLRLKVTVLDAGECQRSCKQTTVNRVLITGFPMEHPEQIQPTENSWLTNLTPAELARRVEKQRKVLVAYDEKAFPYASPTRAPDPYLTPTDTETPFASMARRHRAQYVVSGVYRDFGLRDEGIIFRKKTRHIEIEAFIHDGVSGSVLERKTFTGIAEGKVTLTPRPAIGTTAFYETDLGRAWGQVMNDVADWLTEKTICRPFMARVLKTEGANIYLDAGSDSGLSDGDTLILHAWRKPPTPVRGDGEIVLGQESFSRATASIKYRYPAFSVAEMVESENGIKPSPGDLFYTQ